MSSLSGKNSSSVSIPQRVASIFVFATRLHNTYTVYEIHQEKSHFQFLYYSTLHITFCNLQTWRQNSSKWFTNSPKLVF